MEAFRIRIGSFFKKVIIEGENNEIFTHHDQS